MILFVGRVFHDFEMPPRAAVVNDYRLEQPDDRLGERVVLRIADAAHRRLDPGFGQRSE